MKKSIFPLIVLIVMFALIFVSCQSTAESGTEQEIKPGTQSGTEQPATQPERPAVQVPADLAGPKARADDARKRAVDFEAPAYFPSDWEAVESRYAAAQTADSYNVAADDYDDLFRKTIPLYAQAREDEIMAARDDLIATGLTKSYPEQLRNVDEIAIEALDQYEAGNYYEADDTAAKALNEYETLLLGARVFLTRQEIIDRGFTNYDSDNFNKADDIALTAINEYEAGNNEGAVANAEEAMLRYNLVLANGWTEYSVDRREYAVSERERALSERANIAARDIFREAEALYNQADEVYASENYQDAAILYTDAEVLFVISRYETEEKRLRAIETIRLAEEKIGESNETALEAERIIEGGSR